ncbi:protein kinase [Nonomuraea sp. NPDC050310]|uniref:serine/threonine protein kinase n=1 Tax=Nonomuraea sp. NPDC050310 TaxID=3154935 RepID=UPI0033DA01D5
MSLASDLRPDDPQRIGAYELRGRLGQGGQGVVYLGEAPDGELVALKWLHPHLTDDAVAAERFAREVSVAQRVAPFCTAKVVATGVHNDRPYIASEFVEGRSLAQVVREEGPRSGSALQRLAIGTATALAAIHQAGIVHRDFSPANVLLASDGPRVIDFGIARALEGGPTITSTPMGTPAFMAPEQIMGSQVTPAADMFSWASTIAFASAGTAPFYAESVPAVINRVLNAQPDLSTIDGDLRDLVAACLSKDPAHRPTAQQVIMRLLHNPGASLPEGAAAGGMAVPGVQAQSWATPAGPGGPFQPSGPVPPPGAHQPSGPYAPHQQNGPHQQGGPMQPSGPHHPGGPYQQPHHPQPHHPQPHQPQPSGPHQQVPPPGQPYPGGPQYPNGHPSTPPYEHGQPSFASGQQGFPGHQQFQSGPVPQPQYLGQQPWSQQQQQHTVPAQPKKKTGLLLAAVAAVLALIATVVVIVVVNTGGKTGTTPVAGESNQPPTPDKTPEKSPEQTPATSPPPSPTATPIATEGLKSTTLPDAKARLISHDSDPITLLGFSYKKTKDADWVDYAKNGTGYRGYPNYLAARVSPDGAYTALRTKNYTGDKYDTIQVVNKATGKTTQVKTVKQPMEAYIETWSHDSTRILLNVGKHVSGDWQSSGFGIIDVRDLDATFRARLIKGVDKETNFGFDHRQQGVVGLTNTKAKQKVVFYSATGQQAKAVPNVGEGEAETLFSPSGAKFVTDCPDASNNDHCVYDTASGQEHKRFASPCTFQTGWFDEEHLTCWTDTDFRVIDFEGNLVRKLATFPKAVGERLILYYGPRVPA